MYRGKISKRERDSYAGVPFLALIASLSLLLLLVGPLLLRALDANGDNLPDDWEAGYGITTGAYAATNLVGWWRMEPNSTNAVLDNFTNQINGSLTSFPPSPFGTGLFSNALYFPAIGQVMFPTNAALNPTTNQFTFSAWIQSTNSVSRAATIADWSDAAGEGWSVGATTNGVANVTFYDGTTAQVVTGTNNPINLYDGSWHQVAATYATNQVATVYVDGEGEATNTITGYTPGPVRAFSFGVSDSSTTNHPYALDEVRLYNRALGPQEIPQLPVTYSDMNGTGLSTFQDYVEGLNPFATNSVVTSGFLSSGLTNYYSETPTVTKTSGDGQSVAANTFANNPLVIQVTSSEGTPLAGAPVTFSIASASDGGLSLTGSGTTTTSLSMTTDGSGCATVYYESGPEDVRNNIITATAVTGTGSVSVSFIEYCGLQNGLTLWLEANSGITVDGSGNVSQWVDQSPSAHVATQSTIDNEPQLVPDRQTGTPALSFNGNQWLSGPDYISANNDLTIITVASDTSPSDYGSICALGVDPSTPGSMRGYAYQYSEAQFDAYGVAETTGNPPQLDKASIATMTFSRSSGDVAFYLQGSANGTGHLDVSDLANGFIVGKAGWPGAYWTGNIYEVLVYNRVLTSAEQQATEVYLADKYGIYHPDATWPLAYSGDVQVLIAANQWSKVQADSYVAFQNASSYLPMTGLTAWFKADSGVTTTSGNLVSIWADQTGNYTATRPRLRRSDRWVCP